MIVAATRIIRYGTLISCTLSRVAPDSRCRNPLFPTLRSRNRTFRLPLRNCLRMPHSTSFYIIMILPLLLLLFFSGHNQLSFSNTRSFALLALGFSSISVSDGRIGFLVTTCPLLFLPHTQTGNSRGQMQGFSAVRNRLFTIRSSSE